MGCSLRMYEKKNEFVNQRIEKKAMIKRLADMVIFE